MPKVDTCQVESVDHTASSKPLLSGWVPDWPVPAHVHAFMSTRTGGASVPPFDGLNLGSHVGDDPAAVQHNRDQLARHLCARPVFLNQVHGVACAELAQDTPDATVADACLTQSVGVACTVMVADCLPVLLADSVGRTVAAAHAGWRGLAGSQGNGGVLAEVVRRFDASPHELLAWLGPCIGPMAFEVGDDVRVACLAGAHNPEGVAACFVPVPHVEGKYLCDLARLARLQLSVLGVSQVYGNDGSAPWCTVSQPGLWFSHRRDAVALGSSGRMAASVWLTG